MLDPFRIRFDMVEKNQSTDAFFIDAVSVYDVD